jgi:hypothetical protein
MTVDELADLAEKVTQDWDCACSDAHLHSHCYVAHCPRHTLGPGLVNVLTKAIEDERKFDRSIPTTAALYAKCVHCQRPMAAHCAGCSACWPDHTCRIDCDVNAPHPSWTEPEL